MFKNRPVAVAAMIGALATGIALGAPQAGANVTYVGVERGQSFGSSESALGAGCSYSVIAETDPGQEVVFLDEADGRMVRGAFQPAVVVADASGVARTTWIPPQRGQHHIWVVEYRSEEDYDAYSHDTPFPIGTGISVGPACVVLP
ncbi:hypothetical protein ACWIGW_35200 [Nocardia brasiliensis]|uniref:hypothetical protein n=1 Tax=Nocardia brasiliensis TaxID=37326 RepID=UPI0024577A21|nr:hypothetical protein [Nocardia brasiliensis]